MAAITEAMIKIQARGLKDFTAKPLITGNCLLLGIRPYVLSLITIFMSINIAIADDQQLFLRSLAGLISTFPGFQVVAEGMNGKDLIDKLESRKQAVDIILMDVRMPVMDGAAATQKISAIYPNVKVVALSVKDDDLSILSMIRAGCCAYLLKDISPNELRTALSEVHQKGHYNADLMTTNYRRLIIAEQKVDGFKLTDREKTFLKLACSDLTYRDIAQKMFLSEKTIDGYRESLFVKLNVKTRVGMALEAVKYQLVTFP